MAKVSGLPSPCRFVRFAFVCEIRRQPSSGKLLMHVFYHELLTIANLNLTYKNMLYMECGIEILISGMLFRNRCF